MNFAVLVLGFLPFKTLRYIKINQKLFVRHEVAL